MSGQDVRPLSKVPSNPLYLIFTPLDQNPERNPDSVWCSLSYFCCHFSKVETVIWRLSFFMPEAKLLVLAVDKSFSDDCVSCCFLPAIVTDNCKACSVM